MLVTGSLEAGGAERVLADMANYWSDKGWRVALATWAGPSSTDFYALGPRVQRLWLDVGTPRASRLARFHAFIQRIRKLRGAVEDTRPDAVLSFIDTSNVMTLLACLGLRRRVVVSERVHGAGNESIPWLWRALRVATYRRADAVVAQTPDAVRWIDGLCGVKALCIPNPLRRLPEARDPRESMILAAGRLTHQKGFDLLLRAFANIAPEFPDWRLVIIGTGPERGALEQLSGQLMLADRVEFRTPVKDIESWMSRAGLVVQPSRYEGFPNMVLEALGMSAAVISTDCLSGPAEMIEDGVNGRLVPVDDVPALAKVMRELMADPAQRRRLGLEGYRVRQTYRQSVIMAQWEACLIQGNPDGRAQGGVR
jgi:glycosyltransferase involved in cell wall biosynthesis